MTPFVAAGGAFLLAVLWFDLMFDVQVLRARGEPATTRAVDSIAGYYGRVTTGARPMNRLVGAVMLGTLVAIGLQIAEAEAPTWVGWASLGLVGAPVALAAIHTFPSAVRLGTRSDAPEVQAALARSIGRDHLLCLAAIIALLALQLGFAR